MVEISFYELVDEGGVMEELLLRSSAPALLLGYEDDPLGLISKNTEESHFCWRH